MLRIFSKYAKYEYDSFDYKMGYTKGIRYPLDFLQYPNGVGVYFTTQDYLENVFEVDDDKKYVGTNNINRFLHIKKTNPNIVYYPLFLNNGTELYMINESNSVTNILNIDTSSISRLIGTNLNDTFTQARNNAILNKFDSYIAMLGEIQDTTPIISEYTLSTPNFIIDFEQEHKLNTYLNTLYISQRPEHVLDVNNVHNLLYNFLLLSTKRDTETAYWFADDIDLDVFMDVLVTLLYDNDTSHIIVDNNLLKHCHFNINDIYNNVLKLKLLSMDCLHPNYDIHQFNECVTLSDIKNKLFLLMEGINI